MQNLNKVLIFFILQTILFSQEIFALREAKPTAIDSRIRVMVYNPEDVFRYTGYYGYQTSILFAEDEVIDTISMGDTVSWQIVPKGHRIFLKPMESDATTNMTVITNKRTYLFELHAEEAQDINDPGLMFVLRFLYPDEGNNSSIQSYSGSGLPDLSRPEKYNFNYTLSGSPDLSPLKIFDDGEFTYFEFKDKNGEIPAFFIVDAHNKESIVNYRIAGNYVVLERVVSQLTLRSGTQVVCVFNQTMRPEREQGIYQQPNVEPFYW